MDAIELSSYGLLALVPLALASAFMPTRTLVATRLMLTKRPVPNTLAFVAGNWVWRPVLGFAVLSALEFDLVGLANVGQQTLRLVASAAAFVFAVAAVAYWRLGAKLNEERLNDWSRRFDGLGPGATFGATIALMGLPGTQWLFVAAGSGIIHASRAPFWLQMLALVCFSAGQLALVASPLLLAVGGDERRAKLRQRGDEFWGRAQERSFWLFAAISVVCAAVAIGLS